MQYKRWGTSLGNVKTWQFSSRHELMGLFGNESGFGIASVGVIVFDADRCRNGIIELSPELDSQNQEDSESSNASTTARDDMSQDKN